MHHCDKPVIVVGPGPEVTTGPILVGVDGSDANRPAVAVAEDLASQLGVGAIGLFCTDPMADTFPHPPGWTYPHEDEVRQELSPSLGSGAELVIEHGHPAELIVRTASGRGAQLIVVGIRGRGGFHGLRVGRVPVQVIEHSPVPVVVVPHRA
jgi:nucleotide-binding universal stress UspA family protein